MSEHTQVGNGQTEAQAPVKRKRAQRSPSAPRPAYVLIQLMGEDGNPMPFDKKRIKTIGVERDPNKVLAMQDENEDANILYLRVMLPAGSRAGVPNKPKTD